MIQLLPIKYKEEEMRLRVKCCPKHQRYLRFLELAKTNSDRNVETLGMLGGKLSKNKEVDMNFFITLTLSVFDIHICK